ncbi:MAG: hypothetical protein ABIC57_03105 [bacterium]
MTATIKKLTILISTVFLFLSVFSINPVFAVDTDLNTQVEEEEEARKDAFRTYLGLDLPIETDNPNFQIEFTEPEDTDVEIKIDSGDYSAKKSPYTLPSVSIGKHAITFKFEDEDGVEQTLAEVLIVLPRSPIFSETEELSFDTGISVSFSGTALPNSSVVFLISSDLTMQIVTADADGNWTLNVSEELTEGSHQIVGFVRKDGYASDFSDPITFYVGTSTESSLEVGESDSPFNININWGDIFSEKNKYYFIGAGGVVLLILLVVFGQSFRSNMANGKDMETLNNGKKEEKKMSLRDKLAAEGSLSKEKTKEEQKDKVEEVKKIEKVKTEEPVVPEKTESPVKEENKNSAQSGTKQPMADEPMSKEIDEKIDEENKPKKGFFSFLGFGNKEEKGKSLEEIKKVVTKEEFLDDFKDGKIDGAKKEEKSAKKVEEVKSPKDSSKKVEPVAPTPRKDKKSNTIEVTLG